MPNVTIFAPAAHLSGDEAVFVGFMKECTEVCTGVMQASLDKVHIIFVPTLAQFTGQDAYIEVKVRTGAHRTAKVMEEFMSALEDTFMRHFGKRPRIRCFAYTGEGIFARN